MEAAGIVPDLCTANTLIKGCVQASKLDAAFDLLTEMKSRGVAPDQITYTQLIEGCTQQNRMDWTVIALQDMEDAGISPDWIMHSTLIKSYAAASDVDGTLGSLARLLKQGASKLDRFTMAPVLDVCHSQGGSAMTQLLQTLESVLGSKKCNYTAVSYAVSFVIDGCDMHDHNSEVHVSALALLQHHNLTYSPTWHSLHAQQSVPSSPAATQSVPWREYQSTAFSPSSSGYQATPFSPSSSGYQPRPSSSYHDNNFQYYG